MLKNSLQYSHLLLNNHLQYLHLANCVEFSMLPDRINIDATQPVSYISLHDNPDGTVTFLGMTASNIPKFAVTVTDENDVEKTGIFLTKLIK